MSRPNVSSPDSVGRSASSAIEALLDFVLASVGSTRGTLRVDGQAGATLRAQRGFPTSSDADLFAASGAAQVIEIPVDSSSAHVAIIALERAADGTPHVISPATQRLLATQVPALTQADSLERSVAEVTAAHERLTRSEHLLRAAAQIVSLGSSEHDLVTGTVTCSDELYRILGFDPSTPNLHADQITQLYHPDDDRAPLEAEYARAIRERRPYDCEYRLLRLTGEVIYVRSRGHVVCDDAGTPIRVYGTVQDITKQHHDEAARRDLERHFSAAFDNAPLGISIISAQPQTFGRFVRVNRAYCSLLGRSEAEIVGQEFGAFVHPEDRAIAAETIDRLMTGETTVLHRELRLVRSDHTIVWVGQSRSLMRDPQGAPHSFFTHIENITQRRTDAAQLARINTRLRRSLDDAPIGMALTRTDSARLGQFIEVNPALCRMTGYSLEELSRLNFATLVHPSGRARAAQMLRGLVARDHDSCVFEEQYQRADGSLGWMSVHASIAYDDTNEPLYCIAQIVDTTERKAAESQLEHLAYHDGLTGVLNRRGLSREVRERLIDGNNAPRTSALLLLDLDHFKYVNDTMGHTAGDRILRKLANTLRTAFRANALVARLGGDQFLIVLVDSSEAAAVAAADEIRGLIESRIYLTADDAIRATASIGIVTVDDWHEHTIEEAVAAADGALASAKAQGRNRHVVGRTFVSGNAAMREQLAWLQRIRRALEHDEFRLYAQPILNLHDGIVERYELLLRLIDETGAVRMPSEFLPIAERTGIMPEIDRWVVTAAIDIAARSQRAGRRFRFEINLSGVSLTNETVAAHIEREIRSSTVDPRSLVFEITETAAIENMGQACNFAETISALGCAFALDDFGAGFSSFYYLKYLPFSDLKIDGEFIRNLAHNPADQQIVRAISELARGLGKATIAEFVGDAQTAVLLADYGVDFAQGYFIGEPLPWQSQPDLALPGEHQRRSNIADAIR